MANSSTAVGVAEYFPVNVYVEPGLIVSYSPENDEYQLAEASYSEHIVGVVSKDPSVVLNDPGVGPPVALAGRVIVKLIDKELMGVEISLQVQTLKTRTKSK